MKNGQGVAAALRSPSSSAQWDKSLGPHGQFFGSSGWWLRRCREEIAPARSGLKQSALSRELKACKSNERFPLTLYRNATTSCRRFIPRLSLSTEGFSAVAISQRRMNCSRNPARSPLTGEHSELWGLMVGNSPCFRGCLVSELLLTPSDGG